MRTDISRDRATAPDRTERALAPIAADLGRGRRSRRPAAARRRSKQVAARYAVAVTPAMAALIDPDDPADPIARQFVPDAAELVTDRRRSAPIRSATAPISPVGHHPPLPRPRAPQARPRLRGLLPLLLPPRDGRAGGRRALSAEALDAALAYIARAIRNLGGDRHRRRSAGAVAAPAARRWSRRSPRIEHVKIVRFHTRVPVVAPETDHRRARRRAEGAGQGDLGRRPRQPPARADAGGARRAARGSSTPASRWSARPCCCAGVNDDADDARRLMRAFVECRVKPYYLHHGDLAPGTAHFRTSIEEARR